MKIIPAIDLLGGKCVRLSQGDYERSRVYNADPLEMARRFEDHGIRYLHLVDLDGARAKQVVHYKIIEAIAGRTQLEVDFGGGIRSTEEVQRVLNSGARQVSAGSVAADNPGLLLRWLEIFGPGKILLGADCRNRKIAVHGWQQQSELDVLSFIRQFCEAGIRTVICTDIARDGMLAGPSCTLYRDILNSHPVQLIASGGIASLADLEALAATGCYGAIIGKAIYEQKISLKELSLLC